MRIIPVVIFIHLAFSWWVYTNQDLFPYKIALSSNGNPIPVKISLGTRLFATEQGIPFFIIFVLTTIFYVINIFLTDINFFITKTIAKGWLKFEQKMNVEKQLPKFSEIEP